VSQDRYSATLAGDNEHGDNRVIEATMPRDISNQIEFALSGKPIIQRRSEIPLANIIDRFQDVRHVYNVPSVSASGTFRGVPIKDLNFGEYWLYNDLNVRRAALNSPVIIELAVPGAGVILEAGEVERTLIRRHYKREDESPTRRGRFRRYSDRSLEIFYPHNVYPFGVVGGKPDELVCLASGGLSGRVGNTLEGITRIMHDFFGCEDATSVVDEGYDTFLIVNPNPNDSEDGPNHYLYDNSEFLKKVASFSKWRADKDDHESCSFHYALDSDPPGLKGWPLNKPLFRGLDVFCSEQHAQPAEPNALDIIAVPPRRCQMRAVLIAAVRQNASA
jgi:hypothetical protein